ncbi:hypothetical protein K2173_024248 [Erythroxylum novogranatense]|uniref:Uncharacterized protein n=1 Tax=Erythroxylum novogranatense TaxID=1862640 RepID=A0AAV8UFP4_9ROSI|nr:hypothetical protein K2173_024248 [Erythroxylum novogranatense]
MEPCRTIDGSSTTDVTTVQRVTKKSSDELLRKFADDDEAGSKANPQELMIVMMRVVSKRRKRSSRREFDDGDTCFDISTSALAERSSLLAPVIRKQSVLVRQLGIGRSRLRVIKDIKNKSVLAVIEKTWRKTLEGASKLLLEKRYNRHRRLINDVV